MLQISVQLEQSPLTRFDQVQKLLTGRHLGDVSWLSLFDGVLVSEI